MKAAIFFFPTLVIFATGLLSGCFDDIEQAPLGTPPGNVTGFTAIAGDGQIGLSWVNPSDPDFSGVLIKRGITGYPATTSGGTLGDMIESCGLA